MRKAKISSGERRNISLCFPDAAAQILASPLGLTGEEAYNINYLLSDAQPKPNLLRSKRTVLFSLAFKWTVHN